MDDDPYIESTPAEAWRRMFDYLMATSPLREAALKRQGLTPNDARALHSLEEDAGRPMGVLAAEWGTDASNATWVVDRLEGRGLAERRADPSDRRVKLVVLTPEGARARKDLLEEFHRVPEEIAALNQRDLKDLLRVLRRISPTA